MGARAAREPRRPAGAAARLRRRRPRDRGAPRAVRGRAHPRREPRPRRRARPHPRHRRAARRCCPTAEIVIVGVPLTDATTGLVDAAFLSALPDGALVVNIARGPVADTDAILAEATRGACGSRSTSPTRAAARGPSAVRAAERAHLAARRRRDERDDAPHGAAPARPDRADARAATSRATSCSAPDRGLDRLDPRRPSNLHPHPREELPHAAVRPRLRLGPPPRRRRAAARPPCSASPRPTGSSRSTRSARRPSVDDHYPRSRSRSRSSGSPPCASSSRAGSRPRRRCHGGIPSFGAGRDDIVRLRHLVSHTSGIIEPPLDTPRGLRPSLLAPGRDFAAGTMSRYSTIAFEGIAALIEDGRAAAVGAGGRRRRRAVGATGLTFDAWRARTRRWTPPSRASTTRSSRRCGTGRRAPRPREDLLAIGSATAPDDGSLVSPVTVRGDARPLTAGLPKLEPYLESRGQDWGFTWNLRHSAPGPLARDTFGHGGWAGCRVLDHAVAGRVLRATHQHRRRDRPLRRRRRRAAQRGGRGA